jgi:enamine deaminase RidA (YjgF/YER057c/UK114 family)
MEQIKKTIESAGMTMNDVVSIQVYCTDLALNDAFNGVYSKYFQANFPARAFVGVAKLLFWTRRARHVCQHGPFSWLWAPQLRWRAPFRSVLRLRSCFLL